VRRTVLSLALALVLALGLVVPAAADPIRNPNAEQFHITCGDEHWDIVVTNGVPGHILGSTGMLIAHSFTFAGTITPEVGDPFWIEETETIGQGQKRGLQDRLMTCTIEVQFEEPGFGTFEGTITVQAMLTPQGPRRN
jgi:hypothetical protein